MVVYTAELEREVLLFISGVRDFYFGWVRCVVAVADRRDYYVFVKLFV